jgi:hypothetical protein
MRSATRPRALIASWFDFLALPQRQVAERLQRAIHRAAPDAQEGIKWGNLVFSMEGLVFLAIVPHKAHVNLQIFNATQLDLPEGLPPLDGVGRGPRSLRCRLNQPVDEVLVEMLVSASAGLAWQQAGERQAQRQALRDAAEDLSGSQPPL